MQAYHGELEFDWWDRKEDFLRDMWGGKASLRKIWTLIQRLPAHSALGRKVDPEQWRAEHHLLADLWDLQVAMNTPKGKARETYVRPADRKANAEKEQRRDERIRDAQGRFRKQLEAGGDF